FNFFKILRVHFNTYLFPKNDVMERDSNFFGIKVLKSDPYSTLTWDSCTKAITIDDLGNKKPLLYRIYYLQN
ncbi:MAG: hypothetical protein ACFFC1_18895, partial [Promethearchaeota archaeon]